MVRPFDPDKFRRGITKSIKGISAGFNDPTDWVSTGNYCLNYHTSNNFYTGGIPLGQVTCLAGESGSGKSYIAAGNLVRNAQEQGIFPIILDSENALSEDWLNALGVDTSPEKLQRYGISMVDDVAGILTAFVKDYEQEYGNVAPEDRPKVLFIVDSLGMLSTPTDVAQFERADMKGDMGRKAKSLTALVRQTIAKIAQWNIGFVMTNHTYASQDMFDPDDKISGGRGVIYASSIVIAMKKRKLKVDEDGNKITKERGIRAACKVMKTRHGKPFGTVEVHIPYDTGMDPYSGMYDLFFDAGILTKSGNSYVYVSPVDGTEIKKFKKAWNKNDENCLDKLIEDFNFMKEKANVPIYPVERMLQTQNKIDTPDIDNIEEV